MQPQVVTPSKLTYKKNPIIPSNPGLAASIKYEEDRARKLAQRFSSTKDRFIIRDTWPELYPHMCLMEDRLNFFRQMYNSRLPPNDWFIENTLLYGPKFAPLWADAWKSARFRFMNMDYVHEPDPTEFTIEGSSFNELFQPGFLVFWDPEDPADYEYMFGPKPDCDPEYLQMVRDYAEALSEELMKDEEIQMDPPPEVILKPVSTAGFSGEETVPEWRLEFDAPFDDYEEETLISKRSIAPKGPHETRDIGILKPQSLRRHRRVMWYLQKACTRIKGCVYGRDISYIRDVCRTLGTKCDWFYMRDYTKSGMTVPHPVISAVFQGFFARRPELASMGCKLFENQLVYIEQPDGSLLARRPTTGAPLGLWVEGYTILQYIIHSINKASLGEKKILFSATNDDMIVGFSKKKAAKAYLNVDLVTNSNLGMYYKETKSGLSFNQFVYCEEYVRKGLIQSKESLYTLGLFGAKYAVNVLQAKEYVYALSLAAGMVSENMHLVLKDVMATWADEPEFDHDEFTWPFLFGGWLPCIKNGLDESHLWYANNPDFRVECAYWASRVRLPRKGSCSEVPHLALGRHFGVRLLREPEDNENWIDLVPLFGTERTLKRHYRRIGLDPVASAKQYNVLLRLRREHYNKRLKADIESSDPLVGYLDRHPHSRIESWMPGLVTAPQFSRIVKPDNGFGDEPLFEWLTCLSIKGIVTMDKPAMCEIPMSMFKLLSFGVCNKLEYSYLPMPQEAVGWKVLNGNFKGYLEYYEREARCIVSYGEDDRLFPDSSIWPYMSRGSLRDCIRMGNLRVSHPDNWAKMSDADLGFWFNFRVDRDTAVKDEVPDPEPELEETESDRAIRHRLTEYLAGLWRDIVPSADQSLERQIFERIAPRSDVKSLSFIPSQAVEGSELSSHNPEFQDFKDDMNEDSPDFDYGEIFDDWDAFGG
jgi:hypothetical protein